MQIYFLKQQRFLLVALLLLVAFSNTSLLLAMDPMVGGEVDEEIAAVFRNSNGEITAGSFAAGSRSSSRASNLVSIRSVSSQEITSSGALPISSPYQPALQSSDPERATTVAAIQEEWQELFDAVDYLKKDPSEQQIQTVRQQLANVFNSTLLTLSEFHRSTIEDQSGSSILSDSGMMNQQVVQLRDFIEKWLQNQPDRESLILPEEGDSSIGAQTEELMILAKGDINKLLEEANALRPIQDKENDTENHQVNEAQAEAADTVFQDLATSNGTQEITTPQETQVDLGLLKNNTLQPHHKVKTAKPFSFVHVAKSMLAAVALSWVGREAWIAKQDPLLWKTTHFYPVCSTLLENSRVLDVPVTQALFWFVQENPLIKKGVSHVPANIPVMQSLTNFIGCHNRLNQLISQGLGDTTLNSENLEDAWVLKSASLIQQQKKARIKKMQESFLSKSCFSQLHRNTIVGVEEFKGMPNLPEFANVVLKQIVKIINPPRYSLEYARWLSNEMKAYCSALQENINQAHAEHALYQKITAENSSFMAISKYLQDSDSLIKIIEDPQEKEKFIKSSAKVGQLWQQNQLLEETLQDPMLFTPIRRAGPITSLMNYLVTLYFPKPSLNLSPEEIFQKKAKTSQGYRKVAAKWGELEILCNQLSDESNHAAVKDFWKQQALQAQQAVTYSRQSGLQAYLEGAETKMESFFISIKQLPTSERVKQLQEAIEGTTLVLEKTKQQIPFLEAMDLSQYDSYSKEEAWHDIACRKYLVKRYEEQISLLRTLLAEAQNEPIDLSWNAGHMMSQRPASQQPININQTFSDRSF